MRYCIASYDARLMVLIVVFQEALHGPSSAASPAALPCSRSVPGRASLGGVSLMDRGTTDDCQCSSRRGIQIAPCCLCAMCW